MGTNLQKAIRLFGILIALYGTILFGEMMRDPIFHWGRGFHVYGLPFTILLSGTLIYAMARSSGESYFKKILTVLLSSAIGIIVYAAVAFILQRLFGYIHCEPFNSGGGSGNCFSTGLITVSATYLVAVLASITSFWFSIQRYTRCFRR